MALDADPVRLNGHDFEPGLRRAVRRAQALVGFFGPLLPLSGCGFVLRDTTKGGRSRGIRLTPAAVEGLKQHRQRQLEERLQLGSVWHNEWNLVFTTPLGTPIDPSNLFKAFRRVLEQAGLPRIRFHDLRHTAATLGIQAGVPMKQVQAMLGHASITLTLDLYAHVTPDMQENAAARMQALLTAAVTKEKLRRTAGVTLGRGRHPGPVPFTAPGNFRN